MAGEENRRVGDDKVRRERRQTSPSKDKEEKIWIEAGKDNQR